MAGSTSLPTGFFGLIAVLLIGLAIVWVCSIISSYFLWQSFKGISARLPVGLFGTGGLVFFIGSLLIIAFGIGFFLMFIAEILFAVAFFQLPDNPQPMPAMQPSMGTPGTP